MDKQKYYVITAIDVEHLDADNDWLYISTKPAYGNMDKEPVIEGWAGTTNGIAVYGHGEFDSVEDAIDYIMADFDLCEHRTGDENGEYDSFNQDPDVIHAFKLGKYHPLSPAESYDFLWKRIKALNEDITLATIDEFWKGAEEAANDEGYTLNIDSYGSLYNDCVEAEANKEK
jgi:hypothetical protein